MHIMSPHKHGKNVSTAQVTLGWVMPPTRFGSASSRPHVAFDLVDDWGHELWPRADSGGGSADARAAQLLQVAA